MTPGNTSPPVVVLCGFDGQKLHTCGKTVGAVLGIGRHVLRATASDAQNNMSKTAVFSFRVVRKK